MPGENTRARWRSSIVFVGAVAATLLAVEAGAGWLDGRMAPTLEHHSAEARRMVDEMDVLADADITSDVVFVGNSMTGYAVDTAAVEQLLPDVDFAHNVALGAAQTTLVARWLPEEVIPRLEPSTVVWGVSTLDFNGNRETTTIDAYNEARATRPGRLGDADRWLAEHVALGRRRNELRDAAVVIDAVTDPFVAAPVPGDLGRLANFQPFYLTAEQIEANPALAAAFAESPSGLEANALKDFEIGEEEVAAFREALGELRRLDIETVVVLMPTSTDYRSAHPGGAADYSEAISRIAQLATDEGVHVLDLSDRMSDDAFYDPTHLSPAGRATFSEGLAAELAAIGVGVG